MKIVLALDIATRLGFAVRRADGRVESGAVDFGLRRGERSGRRWVKLATWLVDLKHAHPFDEVVFEDCVILGGPGQTQTARVYGGFVATVERFCEHHQIAYSCIGISTWKKRFTGNGAAKKDDVIAVCRQLGFKPASTDEADALGILHCAVNACPVLTPSPKAKALKRPLIKPGPVVPEHHDGQPF